MKNNLNPVKIQNSYSLSFSPILSHPDHTKLAKQFFIRINSGYRVPCVL